MRVYNGYLKIDKTEINLKNGKTATREILVARNAVAVLCKVRGRDEYLLVNQYRAPINDHITEVVAGCIEAGDDGATTVDKEIRQEIGRKVISKTFLGEVYPSVGYSTENIELWFATVSEDYIGQDLDGDEEVAVVSYTEKDLLFALKENMFRDAKTQLLIMKVL